MNAYPVSIETNSQLKGTFIRTTAYGRNKDEAMDSVLEVLGLNYGTIESITVWPSKGEREG